MTNTPPNPALITATRPHRHRGRTHLHLFTEPDPAPDARPALVASPQSVTAYIDPPFLAYWKDVTSPRGRITRVITGVTAQ